MFSYVILLYAINLIFTVLGTPFIFEEDLIYCTFSRNSQLGEQHGNPIEMNSETVSVKADNFTIHLKFCGTFGLHSKCPEGTAACVEMGGRKISLGTHFIFDDIFKSINGSKCLNKEKYAVEVHFQKNSNNKPSFSRKEGCVYYISMGHPVNSHCGVSVNRRFLDLSPIGKQFMLLTEKRNFSITLCHSDSVCGDEVNACEFIGNTRTNISLDRTQYIIYNEAKNQVELYGVTYKGKHNRIDKRFEVVLKCNWDKVDVRNEDLHYKKLPNQGKRYTFDLETSYGCIKKAMSCVVREGFFIYNLSSLYSENPKIWLAKDKQNQFFLQICGPVILKDPICKNPYSQVCEKMNDDEINWGTIMTNLEPVSDGLLATLEGGGTCSDVNNTLSQYKSSIHFKCSNREEGPELVEKDKCKIHFQWKTKHACPKYNSSSCAYIKQDFHDCIFSENNSRYNLSGLNSTRFLKSESVSDLQFIINVCGPVEDEEVICMKDVSVVAKNLSEINLKSRVISLGKLYKSSAKDGRLVLEYISGSYCDGGDYKSEIHLECSETEEEPILNIREKCHFEFLWKTKHGCPISYNGCSFILDHTNKSFHLDHMKPIRFESEQYKLKFDICRKSYSKCPLDNKDCTSTLLHNPIVSSSSNETILTWNLPMECDSDFNRTIFNLKCDLIGNDGYVKSWKIKDCDMVIDYFTNSICDLQDTFKQRRVHRKELGEAREHANELKTPLLTECFSIKSPFTQHEFDVHTLPNVYFRSVCPTVTFNETFRFIKLHYTTNDLCLPHPTKNISYDVLLTCSDETTPNPEVDDCLHSTNHQSLEFCDFFKSPQTSRVLTIAGFIVLGIVLLTALMGALLMARRKGFCCFHSDYGFIVSYRKDALI